MRTVVIKPLGQPIIEIDATVCVSNGKPVVDFRIGDDDDYALRPVEARRLAVALQKAADCCDAKREAAKHL